MKLAVRIVLLIFITFLATPTIVGIIKNSADTSIFYSMSEEEQVHKEIKEVKAELKLNSVTLISFCPVQKTPIISDNQLKHDNVSATIFSPPPNA